MNLKSKRGRRSVRFEALDRISALPEGVLRHIVSFLPTKYAVRTSILSSRWKNIWAAVPSLDFDMKFFTDLDQFFSFVDHVLFFRYSSDVKKFRLRMKDKTVDYSRINGWIDTAVRRNVVELDLCVGNRHQVQMSHKLPKSLFMCKTLVILKLRSHCVANIPTSRCLPSLKFLHFTFWSRINDAFDVNDSYNVYNLLSKLISNCPILEDLSLDGFPGHKAVNLTIAAPVLKALRIYFCTDGCRYFSVDYNCSINCPKLENLDVAEDFWSTNYRLTIAKSLVQANICQLQHYSPENLGSSRVSGLLAGLSHVTYLCLTCHCFKVYAVPCFENLRLLKLVVFNCFCWELLEELLKRSPILESLVLERKKSHCIEEDSEHDENSEGEQEQEQEVEDGSEHEEGSENEQGSENEEEESAEEEEEEGSENEQEGPANEEEEEGSGNEEEGSGNEEEEGRENHQWNPPEFVPWCLLSHLKNVKLTGFTGQQDEMNVAKYLLKYSEVLDKMIIYMGDLDLKQRAELYKEFSMFPRGSRTCIVQFN